MDNKKAGQWGSIAVSILVLLIFVVAFPVALMLKNTEMLMILVGAAVSNANTAVQYFLGSSNSSAKKDDTIASTIAAPTIIAPTSSPSVSSSILHP